MILLIDNYDSFVYNLARYFEQLGQTTEVVRNDALVLEDILQRRPDAIVISPGPCTPDDAGVSLKVVQRFCGELPILGICLGHQVIAQALGARIERARRPVHGRTSPVMHDGRGILTGLSNPLTACRYHSLVVRRDSLPDCLEASCWLEDDTLMGIRHREFPVVGLQFHPESILSDSGYALLNNWLGLAGLATDGPVPHFERPLAATVAAETPVPRKPLTF